MLLIYFRVLSFIKTGLFCLLVFHVSDIEGYSSRCRSNQTIFVPEKSTATYQTNVTLFYSRFRFYKTAPIYQIIFSTYIDGDNITDAALTIHDSSWENRTHISGQRNTRNEWTIKIEITNTSMRDNGTYYIFDPIFTYDRFCLTLFVMQIRMSPTDVTEENEPVYLFAHPHPSVITRPLAHSTMVWLLDGSFVNQTASFVEQDGLIWIPQVTRGMDGKNATYRAVLDDGDIKEVNFTLDVRYGPSQILILKPEQTHYFLDSGNVMPDITCTTECKPPCNISWGKYSSGETLSLGAVTHAETGEYTCTATRIGIKTIERTITIHVADNTSFTIAIVCLASIQALTTLGLGLYAFLYCRRSKQSPCQTCLNENIIKSQNQATEDCSNSPAADNHGPENYEDLDTNTIQEKHEYDLPSDVGLQTYENVRLSVISQPEVQQTHC